MSFNPETKYPSDIIMAEDWNEAMAEVVNLGKSKLNLDGGSLKGSLRIEKSSEKTNVALHISTDDGITLPSGTQAQRPININQGTLRFNTEDKAIEVFNGDKWMTLMPVGTILPFGGEVVPNGWLSCDGKLVESEEYPSLAKVLNNTWGKHGSKFRLPDLRGMFLRGWDQGAGNDPERNSRTKKQGGNSGDNVGSYQEDQFQGHHFQVYGGGGSNSNDDSSTLAHNSGPDYWGSVEFVQGRRVGMAVDVKDDGNNGVPRIGKETRPKNANVHFIIKY